MNTSTINGSSGTNVTDNERILRAVVGIGLTAAVVAGAIASPGGMFTASMIAIYLAITAIIGLDPHYAAWNALSKTGSMRHHGLTAS